jgi:uncharacterized protein
MLRGAPTPLDAKAPQVASCPMAAPPTHQPADARSLLGPATQRDAWRWLLVALLGLIAGVAVSEVLTNVGAWIAGTPGGAKALAGLAEPPAWFVATELIGLWTGFVGAAVVVTRSGRRIGLTVGAHDVWFLLVGMALQGVVYLAYSHVHESGSNKGTNQLLGGSSGWLLLFTGFLTVVLVPIIEESYFRGVLLRGLLGAWRTRVALVGVTCSVLADAVLFGFAHLGTDEWYQLPGLAFLGAVLAVLAIRTGRLGPSIFTHAGFNLLAVVVFSWNR